MSGDRENVVMKEGEISRRSFVVKSVATVGIALVPGLQSACSSRGKAQITSKSVEVIDDALKMLSEIAPLTNHGPMAAEALVAMGRADRVIPFVERYRDRFSSPYPPRYQTVSDQNWQAALSDHRRITDWIDLIEREIKDIGWRQTVEKWCDRLAPGLSAAAAHGLIRTGHAVRSLGRSDTEARRRELANGLGYWAAFYQALPEVPVGGEPATRSSTIQDAVARIPILPVEMRLRGSIMSQLTALNDFGDFRRTIDSVELQGKPAELLSGVTEAFASIYMKHVSRRNDIALIHAVTGSTSIRHLLPYLSAPTAAKMLRYGWQAAAGIYSISGNETVNKVPDERLDQAGLIDRASTSNEEHAVKFTEACVSEFRLNPKPIYLLAAKDALERLPRHA
ncbi:MAG: questin oxidase family protein [Pyrinomonadaceae bacterium]